MSGVSGFNLALTIVWTVLTVAASVMILLIWRSPEKTAKFRENCEPVRSFGLHARSMAAGSFGGLVAGLGLWAGLLLDAGGRDCCGRPLYNFLLDLGMLGFVGLVVGGALVVTTAIWWWPRWLIPPHLRDREAEEARVRRGR